METTVGEEAFFSYSVCLERVEKHRLDDSFLVHEKLEKKLCKLSQEKFNMFIRDSKEKPEGEFFLKKKGFYKCKILTRILSKAGKPHSSTRKESAKKIIAEITSNIKYHFEKEFKHYQSMYFQNWTKFYPNLTDAECLQFFQDLQKYILPYLTKKIFRALIKGETGETENAIHQYIQSQISDAVFDYAVVVRLSQINHFIFLSVTHILFLALCASFNGEKIIRNI